MTQPKALYLAEVLENPHGPSLTRSEREAIAAELRRLQELLDDCAIYLKEGETPAQRIVRDDGDSIALMELLAREKRKNETLLKALQNIEVSTYDATTAALARVAIDAVEGEKT